MILIYLVADIEPVLEYYDILSIICIKRKRNMQSYIYLNKYEFLYFIK